MIFTAENVKLFNESFNKVVTGHMQDTIDPINKLYLDLSLMFDYKVGTLISIYREDERAYNYIKDVIKTNYNVLFSRNTVSKFPRLGVTEETLLKVLQEPYNSTLITALSPVTSFKKTITTYLKETYIENRKFNSIEDSTIQIYLNNPYFKIPEELIPATIELFANTGSKVTVIHDPDYTNTFIDEAEVVMIEDIFKFNRSPLVLKLFNDNFVYKYIYGAILADEPGASFENKELIEGLEELELILNERTDFKFIYKFIET